MKTSLQECRSRAAGVLSIRDKAACVSVSSSARTSGARASVQTLYAFCFALASTSSIEVSTRVMTKLGMIEECHIRGHILVRGQWRDSIVHPILAPEWRESGG